MSQLTREHAVGKALKALALACVVALCLVLAACGGNSAGSAASSAADSSSSAAADPAEKFVGNWQIAAIEMEGLTVTGDFSSELFGDKGINLTLDLESGGTGSVNFNDESSAVTWSLTSDDAISITPGENNVSALTATYDDGVLTADLQDDEFAGSVYLTADGTMEGVRVISGEAARDFTSESDFVGTWKLTGMNMMGMSMYGSADQLVAMMREDADYATMQINADGTATVMGQEATWAIGSSGATVTVSGSDIPVKELDGDAVIDLSSLAGDTGLDIVMLFSR